MSETYRDASTEAQNGEKNAEEQGPLLNVPQMGNALTVVMRDAKTLSFLKFVSSNQPSDRVDIKMVLPINEDLGHGESDSEESESENEEA